ncbi:DUF4468 domain-containing protein [Mesonia aquimarina]|uniref:DUF4468 domain-containing protein n=1 Tax=Mesonia aquimarina TaxID=1504967 RepID=UPI000EF606DF|nr:DUF4468 domain-containing protein [Mesonia aquimarina]
MKKLLLILPILLLFSCYTQKTSNIDSLEKSFEVKGSKNELYVKANNWMVENFNDAESVIQFSDKETGNITGKYFLLETTYGENMKTIYNNVFAIIKIKVKDGASKITIIPDEFRYYENYGTNKIKLVNDEMNNLSKSYEDYMKNDNSNDW